MHKLIFAISSLFTMISCINSPSQLLADDVRLYKDTPAWELAQAVEKEDTVRIINCISDNPSLISFQEKKFGQTLLNWAVYTKHFSSAKTLVAHGADPNTQDYSGTSAMINSAANFDTSSFLALMIQYGGDVNAVANAKEQQLRTPLIAAVGARRLKNIQILVEAGADINYVSKDTISALYEAMVLDRVDIARYLIIERKASTKKSPATRDGVDFSIRGTLERMDLASDIQADGTRQEILAYLKAHPEQ